MENQGPENTRSRQKTGGASASESAPNKCALSMLGGAVESVEIGDCRGFWMDSFTQTIPNDHL
jgi:hypothetical protein